MIKQCCWTVTMTLGTYWAQVRRHLTLMHIWSYQSPQSTPMMSPCTLERHLHSPFTMSSALPNTAISKFIAWWAAWLHIPPSRWRIHALPCLYLRRSDHHNYQRSAHLHRVPGLFPAHPFHNPLSSVTSKSQCETKRFSLPISHPHLYTSTTLPNRRAQFHERLVSAYIPLPTFPNPFLPPIDSFTNPPQKRHAHS